jgi:hypothetical protein
MAQAITPVSVSHEWFGGTLFTYEVDDSQATTLVNKTLLPKEGAGCKKKWRDGDSLVQTYRMKDGRIRLTISERLVVQRSVGFRKFLAACAPELA